MNIFRFLLVISLIFTTCSCAGKTVRGVDGNTVYSSRAPSIKVVFPENMKYIGSSDFTKIREFDNYSGKTTTKNEKYLFIDNNNSSKAEKIASFAISKLNKGYWLDDVFNNQKNKLLYNITKINGDPYEQVVLIDNYKYSAEIKEKGYIPSRMYMFWSVARISGANSEILHQVLYGENIDNFPMLWKPIIDPSFFEEPILLNNEQQEALNSFIERAKNSVKIYDFTAKDLEKFAPQGKVDGPQNSDNYNKLLELKKLKDDGVLNEEEFNTKKKEILQNY